MKIKILKLDFSGSGHFEESIDPTWSDIKRRVARLAFDSGRVDLYARVEGSITSISITGQEGLYVVDVSAVERRLFKLLSNSSTENPKEVVPMCDGECPRENTIDDLDKALEMIESYLVSGTLTDSAPFFWRDH